MITRIVVPDVGASGSEARLSAWLAKEGDLVAAGAPLFELETDKATQAIEAFRGGYLRRILVPADAVVNLGDAVALLADSLEEPLEPSTAGISRRDGTVPPHLEPRTSGSRPDALPVHSHPRPAAPPGKMLASPLARRLARAHNIDLAQVAGSGTEGEIHQRDVVRALADAPRPLDRAAAPTPEPATDRPGRRVPLSAMRRAIAARTQLSKSTIPHFYADVTIDMTAALAVCDRLASQARTDGRPAATLNDLILLAAARALRQTPDLNASVHDSEVFYFEDVDVGVAVAVEGGVLAPVLRAADKHDIWSLSAHAAALYERVRGGQLSGKDLSGAALTVSNLGMFGLDRFTAVINPPQAAALAVGAATPQPAVHQGQLTVRTLMHATLSVDHRLADGVVAARFLNELRRLLEAAEETFDVRL